jgi:hypothetical protein
MKTTTLISLLATSVAFSILASLAQAQITITIVETFNYPGATDTESTIPRAINDRGDIVGTFTNAALNEFAFVRYADGSFSPLITEPNDTTNLTTGDGINNLGTICGNYMGSDQQIHGFFKNGETFTEYNYPGASSTAVFGINDAGDFVGSYGSYFAFASIGGTARPILPQFFGLARAINNANAIVGDYQLSLLHGFYRGSTGPLRYPVDAPGATTTVLSGINDKNWMVGTFVDDTGYHGLLFIAPQTFVTFDYGGNTFLQGINRAGLICGNYNDHRLNQTRGFTAIVTRGAGDESQH